MAIEKVMAEVAVADLAEATGWYERLFGRPADALPMEGLAEWHSPEGALQLWVDVERAGRGLLTLQVDDLPGQLGGAAERGLEMEPVDETSSETVSFLTVTDPDGNRVTLVELKTAS